jgi:hypothetical protein
VLIDKGEDVGFVLEGGKKIDAPKRAGMLHDPSGRAWPKCSLLVMSYRRSSRQATDDELRGESRDYFGRDYDACVSTIDTPPKAIGEWSFVGDVKRVFYWRPGKHQGVYKHDINKPHGFVRVLFLFRGKMRAKLYRRGRTYRLELDNCALDDRGIVRP